MSNPNKNAVDFANLIKDKSAMRKDIAPVETSATASQAYKAGDKFYYENLLREATQDIAQGDTLTLNTNYKNADPVTTSIQNLSTVVSKNGAKNKLPYPYSYTTRTSNGVTFTDNHDGSITLNGTNTGNNTTFMYHLRSENTTIELLSKLKKMNTSFKLIGGVTEPYTSVVIDFYDSSNTYISTISSNRSGTPTEFTIPSNAEKMDVFTRCSLGAVYSNLTIYPMLYLASDANTEYQPYSKTNVELTADSLATIDNRNILGAKNLLPFDLATVKAINTSGTWSGNSYTYRDVTFTPTLDNKGNLLYVNVDGTNSSSTSDAPFIIASSDKPFYLPSGNYKLNGCPSGGSNSTYNCYVKYGSTYEVDTGNGKDFTINSGSQALAFVIGVEKSATVSNIKFYPMIRLASDPDATYVPYAMGNRELTQALAGLHFAKVEFDAPEDTSTYANENITTLLGLSSVPKWWAVVTAEAYNSSNSLYYQISTDVNNATTAYCGKAAVENASSLRVKITHVAYTKIRILVAYIP